MKLSATIAGVPLIVAIATIARVEVVATPGRPQLKYVNVVFRHGDRTPDRVEMYPTDPHYLDSFYPEGIGGLTNVGKRREYDFGKLLRFKYNDFLGDKYLPDSIFARSTDYKRTKMSLQLLLASLYPPKGDQVWNNQLNWQPIPTTYVPASKDWLMIAEDCPEYLLEKSKVESSPEVIDKIESFRDFMDELTELTGKNITKPLDMYNLYHIMVAESDLNMTLPEWTQEFFPQGKLVDGILLWYEFFSYNTAMRRLNGGKLLYNFLSDMQAVKSGQMKQHRKIALYSGHETNVAALLQTLGIYKPHVPNYTSAVIVELYELDDEYYIKVLYHLGIPSVLIAQKIPGCDILCPFDKFIELLNDVIPSSDELVCDINKQIYEPISNAIQQ